MNMFVQSAVIQILPYLYNTVYYLYIMIIFIIIQFVNVFFFNNIRYIGSQNNVILKPLATCGIEVNVNVFIKYKVIYRKLFKNILNIFSLERYNFAYCYFNN